MGNCLTVVYRRYYQLFPMYAHRHLAKKKDPVEQACASHERYETCCADQEPIKIHMASIKRIGRKASYRYLIFGFLKSTTKELTIPPHVSALCLKYMLYDYERHQFREYDYNAPNEPSSPYHLFRAERRAKEASIRSRMTKCQQARMDDHIFGDWFDIDDGENKYYVEYRRLNQEYKEKMAHYHQSANYRVYQREVAEFKAWRAGMICVHPSVCIQHISVPAHIQKSQNDPTNERASGTRKGHEVESAETEAVAKSKQVSACLLSSFP